MAAGEINITFSIDVTPELGELLHLLKDTRRLLEKSLETVEPDCLHDRMEELLSILKGKRFYVSIGTGKHNGWVTAERLIECLES